MTDKPMEASADCVCRDLPPVVHRLRLRPPREHARAGPRDHPERGGVPQPPAAIAGHSLYDTLSICVRHPLDLHYIPPDSGPITGGLGLRPRRRTGNHLRSLIHAGRCPTRLHVTMFYAREEPRSTLILRCRARLCLSPRLPVIGVWAWPCCDAYHLL